MWWRGGGDELWLSANNAPLSYQGLYRQLKRRGAAAGLDGFHPHQLRHTAAVRWLRAGGTVPGLMAQCGWSSVKMVQAYIQHVESELAIEENHRLRLDNL